MSCDVIVQQVAFLEFCWDHLGGSSLEGFLGLVLSHLDLAQVVFDIRDPCFFTCAWDQGLCAEQELVGCLSGLVMWPGVMSELCH